MIEINYLGHSCFTIKVKDKVILIDPFISPNELAKGIDINEVKCDYILVSHGHNDHVADLVAIAKRTNAKVVGAYEIIEWVAKQGVDNGHPMNLGGSWEFDFGTVKMMYAAHSNSLPDGSYGGTAAGFILKLEDKIIYYAGDTALMQEMKLTGELYKIDCAFLPIGDNFTMGVDDAVIASKFINCDNIIAMHYDTFGYIKVNNEQAIATFKEAGITLNMLPISLKPEDAFKV